MFHNKELVTIKLLLKEKHSYLRGILSLLLPIHSLLNRKRVNYTKPETQCESCSRKRRQVCRLSFDFYCSTVEMSLCSWLALVTLIPVISSTNPGVEIKLTTKGLEYGKHCRSSFFLLSWRAAIDHQIILFFRQTTGDGFNPAGTQKDQCPRFFRDAEGVSDRRCPVQPVQVRHPFVQEKLRLLRWCFSPGAFTDKHVVPSSIQIMNVGLPTSAVALAPGTGVTLSIGNAVISLHGNWRVKYFRIM